MDSFGQIFKSNKNQRKTDAIAFVLNCNDIKKLRFTVLKELKKIGIAKDYF